SQGTLGSSIPGSSWTVATRLHFSEILSSEYFRFTISLELGIPLSILSTARRTSWTLPVTFARASIGRTSRHIWNQQAWQLACGWNDPQQRQISNFTDEQILERAKAHLTEFHYIGFAESFAADSKAI